MPDREIASVVWHQFGHHIDVIYVEGSPDRLDGPHEVAAGLAADAGLELVPTSDGTIRWTHPSA